MAWPSINYKIKEADVEHPQKLLTGDQSEYITVKIKQ